MSKKEYFCLTPASFKLDGGAMFGIIPRPLWAKCTPPDELNRIDLNLRIVLIKTANSNIIIDTGIGDGTSEKFKRQFAIRERDDSMEEILNKVNLSCHQITDVIISHLHFDHAGGLGRLSDNQIVTTFPNATLHLHKNHFDYAIKTTARDQGSFLSDIFGPVINYYQEKKQINWLTQQEGIIKIANYHLNYMTTNGHTPHMLHPYDENFFYLADIIPTINHLKIPWVMGYDVSPNVSTTDKRAVLELVTQKNLSIIFEHDPHYWGGTIQFDAKKGHIIKEKFTAVDEALHPILVTVDSTAF